MRRWRSLRAQGRARLAGFEVPRPFSVQALCEQLARSRGRELLLHPLPFTAAPDLPCGMWLATGQVDHIFHAKGASALHQQNIVLHEIGHMLCDHSLDNGGGGALAALFTDLDPKMVQRVLMRTHYSTPEEQEAEMVAALILEKAGWSPAHASLDGALGALSDVFGVSGKD